MSIREDSWRSFFFTLADDVFFNVVRNYLGPVQTPYNKHDLLERLSQYLQQEDTIGAICSRLDDTDIDLLSAIDLIRPEQVQQLHRFFGGGESLGQMYTRLLNMEDRLLIFRDPKSETFRLTPQLEPALRSKGVGPQRLFPSRRLDAKRVPPPWLNDLLSLAIANQAVHDSDMLKSDGTLKRGAEKRLQDLIPAFSENSERTGRAIGALRSLSLLEFGSQKLSAPPANWQEWSALPTSDRHFLLWAAFARQDESGNPAVASGSNFEIHRDIWKLAEIFRNFLRSLDPSHGYKRSTLSRMLQLMGGNRPSGNAIDPELQSLIDLGLFSPNGEWFQPNPIIQQMTGSEDSDHRAAVAIIQSDYHITLPPGCQLSSALSAAFCCELTDFDLFAQFEIQRHSLFKGLSAGYPADRLLPQLRALGNGDIPQNVAFSIDSWVQEFQAVRVQPGYLIQSGPAHREILSHYAQGRSDVIPLENDAFLFPADSSDWIDDLESRGLHIKALLNLERSREGEGSMAYTALSQSPSAPSWNDISNEHSEAEIQQAADALENTARCRNELEQYIRSLKLNEDVETELLLRLKKGLILEQAQVHAGMIRPDIFEARGLNYQGKLRLIETALSNSDLLELFISGNEEGMLVRPVKIHKKSGQSSDMLEARTLAEDSQLLIHISKARVIRRLRGSLFSYL